LPYHLSLVRCALVALSYAYLRKGLPNLELEFLNALLEVLRLGDYLLKIILQFLFTALVFLLELLELFLVLLLKFLHRFLELPLENIRIFLAVLEAFLQKLQIAVDDLLEQQVVLGDVGIGILQRQDLVRPVLGDSVGAVNAEDAPFGEAVEREDVVVGHAPQLHVVAVHQVEQIDAGLHSLLLVAQLATYHPDVCSEIRAPTVIHCQPFSLRRLRQFLQRFLMRFVELFVWRDVLGRIVFVGRGVVSCRVLTFASVGCFHVKYSYNAIEITCL